MVLIVVSRLTLRSIHSNLLEETWINFTAIYCELKWNYYYWIRRWSNIVEDVWTRESSITCIIFSHFTQPRHNKKKFCDKVTQNYISFVCIVKVTRLQNKLSIWNARISQSRFNAYCKWQAINLTLRHMTLEKQC